MHLIETGRVDTRQLVSTRMKLSEGEKAYDIWDKREATKIVLSP